MATITVLTGSIMVETGQALIRQVRFLPPGPGVVDLEVNTVRGIRDRGGPHEFLTSQRLDFDLLVHIEHGTARHTVDFADFTLHRGDVLWVRAGQVHQWGEIDDIEGTVAMFGPHTADEHARDLIRSELIRLQNHWPRSDLAGTAVPQAIQLLIASGANQVATGRSDLRQAGRIYCLTALLMQLALAKPANGPFVPGPTHEAFTWFRDHIDEHFRTRHKVTEYADRLGYSTRTLNRLARQNTGLSAKELIDERIVLEAKRQLSHTNASVAEVALWLGFDDASNFSSYFLRQAGTTPGTFRVRSRTGHGAASGS